MDQDILKLTRSLAVSVFAFNCGSEPRWELLTARPTACAAAFQHIAGWPEGRPCASMQPDEGAVTGQQLNVLTVDCPGSQSAAGDGSGVWQPGG